VVECSTGAWKWGNRDKRGTKAAEIISFKTLGWTCEYMVRQKRRNVRLITQLKILLSAEGDGKTM
jgi:hypothetical protein